MCLVTILMIVIVNKSNFQTYIWVCNTEEQFTAAFEVGAEGVMTDYPSLLKEYLDRNPKFRHDFNENDKLITTNEGDGSSSKKS